MDKDKEVMEEVGARPQADQALVASDGAAARLHPAGVDPSRGMRERLARLIEPNSWKALGKGLGDSLAHENRRTSSLRKASRILAELREPTEAMVLAGAAAVAPNIVNIPHGSPTRDAEERMRDHVLTEAAETWRSMVNEAARDSDGSPKGGDACGSVHDSAVPPKSGNRPSPEGTPHV